MIGIIVIILIFIGEKNRKEDKQEMVKIRKEDKIEMKIQMEEMEKNRKEDKQEMQLVSIVTFITSFVAIVIPFYTKSN